VVATKREINTNKAIVTAGVQQLESTMLFADMRVHVVCIPDPASHGVDLLAAMR